MTSVKIAPIHEVTSWDAREVYNKGDMLQVLITNTIGRTPPEVKPFVQFVVNDAVIIQMQVKFAQDQWNQWMPTGPLPPYNQLLVLFKFTKLKLEDNEYCIHVTDNATNLNESFITNDRWRLIYHGSLTPTRTQVTMNIARHKLTSPFESLFTDSSLTDLTIIGSNGHVQLHAAVLAAHSSVCRKVLQEKSRSTLPPYTIELPHIDLDTLLHLKDYLYRRILPNVQLMKLRQLAEQYAMVELIYLCSKTQSER